MANDLRAFGITPTNPTSNEETVKAHQDRELIARASARPTSSQQRADYKHHIMIGEMTQARCPEPNDANRLTALGSHLIVVDETVRDPRCTTALTDQGCKKITVCAVRVAGRDGQPRKVASLSTGIEEDCSIQQLIAELRYPGPLDPERYQSTAKLDIASGLGWA